MPKRADLTYPRLTVRKTGRWGVWPTTVTVRILYGPGQRERTLTIEPNFPWAHATATTLIARCLRNEETP